jgi:hypothetical protein
MLSRVSAFGLLLLALLAASPSAHAFTVSISPASRMLYLRVGDGAFSNNTYTNNGSPADSATVNLVSVTVPANVLGDGTDQAMTGNATQLTSNYDGYAFCNAGQIYIGGFLRLPNSTSGTATLTVTSPASLTNATGETIPISQISWTSSGNGDTGTQPIPAGTFTGTTQTLASFPRNQWQESCHSFRYGNDSFVAAGTYTARVTYTLAAP